MESLNKRCQQDMSLSTPPSFWTNVATSLKKSFSGNIRFLSLSPASSQRFSTYCMLRASHVSHSIRMTSRHVHVTHRVVHVTTYRKCCVHIAAEPNSSKPSPLMTSQQFKPEVGDFHIPQGLQLAANQRAPKCQYYPPL